MRESLVHAIRSSFPECGHFFGRTLFDIVVTMSEDTHGDVELELEDEMGDVAALKEKMRKLRETLEKAKKERQEYLDGWQRCRADAANAKQESARTAQKMGEMLREELVHDIIPVLDSFDMAAGSESWAQVNDGFRTGMEAVRYQLLDVLERHGIKRFGKVGEHFDPRLHDVAQEDEDAPGESGSVCKILRHGYTAGERVLRPAHVILKK